MKYLALALALAAAGAAPIDDPVMRKISHTREAGAASAEKDRHGAAFYCIPPERTGRYSVAYCASENDYLLMSIKKDEADALEMRMYKKPGRFSAGDSVVVSANVGGLHAQYRIGIERGNPYERAEFPGCPALTVPEHRKTIRAWPLDVIVKKFINSRIMGRLATALAAEDATLREKIFEDAENASVRRIRDMAAKQIERTDEYRNGGGNDPLGFYKKLCGGK